MLLMTSSGFSVREKYAELDDEEGKHLAIDTFKSWALEETNLYNPFLSFFSLFLGLITVGSLLGWLLTDMPALVFLVALACDLLLAKVYAEKMASITDGISNKEKNLMQLSTVLEVIENSSYESEMMKGLCEKLKTDGVKASDRIRQIAYLINSFENARSNMALQPFNIMLHVNLREN